MRVFFVTVTRTVAGMLSVLCPVMRFASVPLLLLALSLGADAAFAQAQDPLKEILDSKELRKFGGAPVAKRSKLRYALRPWFTPGSNAEALFSNASVAPQLIEWLKPTDPIYQLGEVRTVFEKTHIHVDVAVMDRQRGSVFQLTVLVPHPAFVALVESGAVDDFAQREPPRLKVSSSEQIVVNEVAGVKHRLQSERCSALFKIGQTAWIEVRSVEPCGQFYGLMALLNQLDLTLFEQKLRS